MLKGYLSEIFVSFQGEGLHVGRRHLFLRLSGCHLRCSYCDTPGSLTRSDRFRVHSRAGAALEGRNPLTCAETIAVALPLIEDSLDGLAITGGEPLLQAEYLGELLADARWPRPRMLETSGTLPKQLEALLSVVDLVSMDLKLPSNTGESPLWDVHRECLELARGKIYVKVLVDDETASDELERAADLVREVSPEIPVFLQPITNSSGQITLRSSTLDRLHALARRHVADVRVVPQTHKMLGVL